MQEGASTDLKTGQTEGVEAISTKKVAPQLSYDPSSGLPANMPLEQLLTLLPSQQPVPKKKHFWRKEHTVTSSNISQKKGTTLPPRPTDKPIQTIQPTVKKEDNTSTHNSTNVNAPSDNPVQNHDVTLRVATDSEALLATTPSANSKTKEGLTTHISPTQTSEDESIQDAEKTNNERLATVETPQTVMEVAEKPKSKPPTVTTQQPFVNQRNRSLERSIVLLQLASMLIVAFGFFPFLLFQSGFLIVLGVGVIFIGLVMGVWAKLHFGQPLNVLKIAPSSTTILATGGPYARMRHPVYVAIILIGFGLVLAYPTITRIMGFALLLYVLHVKTGYEEALLENHFRGYGKYKSHTGRFFPKKTTKTSL